MELVFLANLGGDGWPALLSRSCTITSTTGVAFGTQLPSMTVAESRLASLGNTRCCRRNYRKLHIQGNRGGFQGNSIMISSPSKQSPKLCAPAARSKEPGVTRAASEAGGEQARAQDTASKSKVTFQLQKQIHFGQTIKVIGSTPELGQWDLGAAISLVWSEGHLWTADVAVTVGQTVEYKFIITGTQGELDWQPGENRIFEVKDAGGLLVSEPWDTSGETVEQPGESGNYDTSAKSEDVAPVAGQGTAVNSVVPGADLVEGAVAVAEMAGAQVQKAVDDALPGDILDERKQKEGEDEEEEASEVPVVDAIVAATFAEGKKEDDDPAA